MNIVLMEPEIPPNTGNIARLCAATNSKLHLVEPFGFELGDKQLQRAGMDYWRHVAWFRHQNWESFLATVPDPGRLWFVESDGPVRHSEAQFEPGDYLVFGRETAGLPKALYMGRPDRWVRIPMFNPAARSINLANCAAIVLYEALRQSGFPGELPPNSVPT